MSTTVTMEEMCAFMAREFPQMNAEIVALGDRSATLRCPVSDQNLRPGGTISGPTMMAAADGALYVAIMGEIGLVALAVTTSLNFNFLRKPKAGAAIIAKCTLLKLGKSLAVGEVSIFSEGEEAPVAHAVGTYSIPPKR